MTVSTVVNHEQYEGNGTTTVFPFRFRILKSSHMVVTVSDTEGVLKTLTLGTDYTITGVGFVAGGNVVLTSPLAEGWLISLDRDLPAVQETDLRNQGRFFAETHEDAFDYLTMLIQRTMSLFGLALRKPSWIANYYDALLNRISNLADPSLPQDAVTKNYADNVAQLNLNKTLRVPEAFVSPVPEAQARANRILGFNSDGDPIAVVPGTGDASQVMIDLASYEPDKGDALIGVRQPFAGSAHRTQHEKNADIYNMRDADSVDPTGVIDSTIGIQNLLNSFGIKGGVVNIRSGDKFLIGNLTIPQNVGVVGSMLVPGETINSSGQDYSNFGSTFIQKPNTTITLKRGSSVHFVQNIPKWLYDFGLITNDAQASDAISSFSGTAYTSKEADFILSDILVIGFEYPVRATPTASDTGRRVLENFKYDCTNGPYISYATDIDRFRGVHGWPFLTAHVSGLSPVINDRSGTGFTLDKVADFAYLDCCFNYGYNIGFALQNVWNVTISGGGADRVKSTGVSYSGNCRFCRINNFIINSDNTGININITQGSDLSFNPDVKTSNCIINGVAYGVYVNTGAYYSLNDTFMGGIGVAYSDGTIGGGIFNPLFDGVTTPIIVTPASDKLVSRGKFNYTANQPVSTTAEKTFATQSIYYDLRQAGPDVGHIFEQGGSFNSGLQGFSRTGPRLRNATPGSEQADYTVTAFNKGVWVDRFVMTGDGVLRPVADGIQLLGAPSYRWGQIYSSVGTISTSDENEKSNISPVPDTVLDAWSKVDFAMYKLKHAVDGKGADARFHFGLIAQRVKSAFESLGLDPFAYGILCFDEWDAEGEQVDHYGNVTAPARDAGSRYGIRYDEAWILECALMRRTINELKSAK